MKRTIAQEQAYESPQEPEYWRACRFRYADALAPERKPPASKWGAIIVLAILCGVLFKGLDLLEWVADQWREARIAWKREHIGRESK